MLGIFVHIIFHKNFTQNTRSTKSICLPQGDSTTAVGIQKTGFNRHEFPENRNTHDRKCTEDTYENSLTDSPFFRKSVAQFLLIYKILLPDVARLPARQNAGPCQI